MRKIFLIFLLTGCLPSMYGQNFSSDTLKLHSQVLGEGRALFVHKSKNISPSDSVRLIFFLDGNNSADHYKRVLKKVPNPNYIAISIENTNRKRDMLYANEAKTFLSFITNELMLLIDSLFTVKEKILFGHSFSGSFCVFALLNNPNAFNKYIASSPTPIVDLISVDLYNSTNNKLTQETKLHVSYGDKDMKQVKKWCGRLTENLNGKSFSNLQFDIQQNPEKKHYNNDASALIQGLVF